MRLLTVLIVICAGVSGCRANRTVIVIQKPLPHTCVSRSIYVFEGSSSKFLAVYADREMTTPLPNPLFIGCDSGDYTFWTAGNARIVASEHP
jgi:hypothetical protein